MKSNNNLLIFLGLAGAAYYINKRSQGTDLAQSGCADGGIYEHRPTGLFTDFCPLQYKSDRWFKVQNRLFPESELGSLGFIEVIPGTWVGEAEFKRLKRDFEIARSQGVANNINQFVNVAGEGYDLVTTFLESF